MKRSTANHYMSQYILLRDAIKLGQRHPGMQATSLDYVECCTCGRVMNRFAKNSHAGHYVPKGMGGSSGVYFDERNVNIISAFVFEGHPHAKLLKNAGFIPNTVSPYMTITIFDDISEPLSQLFDSRVEEALFTKGDLDWV